MLAFPRYCYVARSCFVSILIVLVTACDHRGSSSVPPCQLSVLLQRWSLPESVYLISATKLGRVEASRMSAPKEVHLNERIDLKWLLVRGTVVGTSYMLKFVSEHNIDVNEWTRQRFVRWRHGLIAQGRDAHFCKITNGALGRWRLHPNFDSLLYTLIPLKNKAL